MDPLLQFLLLLCIIIVAAKGAGYVSTRLGQPAVLGELLIGLVLGPTLLDVMHWPLFSSHLAETIEQLAHLGVLLLMFAAGLEVDLGSMARAGRPALLTGVLGVLSPVVFGMAVARPFGFGWEQSLAIGLVLAATSVSISAQTLLELRVLRSRVGIALLGAAVVDDVLVILLFSLFAALVGGSGGGAVTVLWVTGRMVLVLGLLALLGALLIPRLVRVIDRLPISEGVMAFAFVVTLLFAWGAEYLGGIAAITGAFLAGLFFARTPLRQHIEGRVHTLAYSWLVPIFFVSIGLESDARVLGAGGLPFALALITIAILSKLIGGGLGARLGGFTNRDSLRIGVGMISRGEVGLILASVALGEGLLTEEVFAAVVVMVLATTLVTPILLRALYPRTNAAQGAQAEAPAAERGTGNAKVERE